MTERITDEDITNIVADYKSGSGNTSTSEYNLALDLQDARARVEELAEAKRELEDNETKVEEIADVLAARNREHNALREAGEFAVGAIEDAIYGDDGLDGETGWRVIKLLYDAGVPNLSEGGGGESREVAEPGDEAGQPPPNRPALESKYNALREAVDIVEDNFKRICRDTEQTVPVGNFEMHAAIRNLSDVYKKLIEGGGGAAGAGGNANHLASVSGGTEASTKNHRPALDCPKCFDSTLLCVHTKLAKQEPKERATLDCPKCGRSTSAYPLGHVLESTRDNLINNNVCPECRLKQEPKE